MLANCVIAVISLLFTTLFIVGLRAHIATADDAVENEERRKFALFYGSLGLAGMLMANTKFLVGEGYLQFANTTHLLVFVGINVFLSCAVFSCFFLKTKLRTILGLAAILGSAAVLFLMLRAVVPWVHHHNERKEKQAAWIRAHLYPEKYVEVGEAICPVYEDSLLVPELSFDHVESIDSMLNVVVNVQTASQGECGNFNIALPIDKGGLALFGRATKTSSRRQTTTYRVD
jgi:hypothetical protein